MQLSCRADVANDASLSMRQVAAALGMSKTTASEISMSARDAGVDWLLVSTLSEEELQARLYPPRRPRSTIRLKPEHAALHQELKRPGVTLQLLWQEYRASAGETAYRYSAYCQKYRPLTQLLKRLVRMVHYGSGRLFNDVPIAVATTPHTIVAGLSKGAMNEPAPALLTRLAATGAQPGRTASGHRSRGRAERSA